MSAKLGACARCGKTVYQLEGVTAAKQCFHKSCFKCATCKWQLTLSNYKSLNDEVYCPHHFPVTGFGENHAHGTVNVDSKHIESQYSMVSSPYCATKETNVILDAPKMETVNHQVHGESAGAKTNVGIDSMHISKPMSAPKVDTVNQQIHGENAGAKTNVGMDSMHISKPMSAPKMETVNQQIIGENAGAKTNVGVDSIHIAKPLNAPKLDTMGGVHRGYVNS